MKKVFSVFVCIAMLQTAGIAQLGQNHIRAAQGNFSQYLVRTMKKNTEYREAGVGMINRFNTADNTIGKRFLFDTWVTADSVIEKEGAYIDASSFLFNFDKVTGSILASQDKVNIMAVAPEGIQSFVLAAEGTQYRFESVKLIGPGQFYLALVKTGGPYSLYKRFGTKFMKANYRDDGVVQMGRREDEYKDENEYYIVDNNTTAKLIGLKTKSIRSALGRKDEVDLYFSRHKDEPVDENFLIGLVRHLNEPSF